MEALSHYFSYQWPFFFIVCSAAIIFILYRKLILNTNNLNTLRIEHRALQERINHLKSQEDTCKHAQQILKQTQSENQQLKEKIIRLQEKNTHHEEKLAWTEAAKKQLKIEFENLAQTIFEYKSKHFAEYNKSQLHPLLIPLQEQIKNFKSRIEDIHENQNKDRIGLHKEITQLKELNQNLSQEAIELTRVLKGDSRVQGHWGELVLERILEKSGLRQGHEFFTQQSFQNSAGGTLRPDVVVHLPEGKHIIIDAKVSLSAYERYCQAEDTEERTQCLKKHMQSMNTHILNLSKKRYNELESLYSPDFVLMFVPIEGAYMQTIEADENIVTHAFNKGIMLVCPSTLLVTLRTVHNYWRYEHQNQNALEIAKKAGDLHDHFVRFIEALMDVSDKLQKAQQAHECALKRLSTGKGNLIKRVSQLSELGIKTEKKIPKELLSTSEE